VSAVPALRNVGKEEHDGLSRNPFYATTLGTAGKMFAFQAIASSSPSESYSMI
jgi:hypothetical protein